LQPLAINRKIRNFQSAATINIASCSVTAAAAATLRIRSLTERAIGGKEGSKQLRRDHADDNANARTQCNPSPLANNHSAVLISVGGGCAPWYRVSAAGVAFSHVIMTIEGRRHSATTVGDQTKSASPTFQQDR